MSLSKDDVKELIRLYEEEEKPINEIGRHFNVANTTVSYHLKKNNVSIRVYNTTWGQAKPPKSDPSYLVSYGLSVKQFNLMCKIVMKKQYSMPTEKNTFRYDMTQVCGALSRLDMIGAIRWLKELHELYGKNEQK